MANHRLCASSRFDWFRNDETPTLAGAGVSDRGQLSRASSPVRESGNYPLEGRNVFHGGMTPSRPVVCQIRNMTLVNIPQRPPRRSRFPLSDAAIADIWARLRAGDIQHDIAADYGTNPGRVSEINTGKRGNHVTGLPKR